MSILASVFIGFDTKVKNLNPTSNKEVEISTWSSLYSSFSTILKTWQENSRSI